jgi:carbon-monoxide dehydrogenase small subunit
VSTVKLTVNGKAVSAEVEDRTLLVHLLRENLNLTGTHVGCDNHGLQCGYCTPGMIMSAIDIVHRHSGQLDEETVRQELEGNICRCTGYHNIVKAVLDAAGRMKVAQAAE